MFVIDHFIMSSMTYAHIATKKRSTEIDNSSGILKLTTVASIPLMKHNLLFNSWVAKITYNQTRGFIFEIKNRGSDF